MTAIRTLIIDDEPAARAGIRKLLDDDPEFEIVGEAGDGMEAVSRIQSLRPDLVFLDVQMPELDGFGVIELIGVDDAPVIVFVTAYDRFALRAFEVQALDYLLKPFDDERFRTVVARVKHELRSGAHSSHDLNERLEALLVAHAASRPLTSRFITRVPIREGGSVSFYPVERIDWIEAADYYSRLHGGGTTQLVRQSMNELEAQLDPRRFLRVHRSAIVNLARVKEIRLDYQNRHTIVLHDDQTVPLSRSKKDELEDAISRAR